jgi:hypothetical protein
MHRRSRTARRRRGSSPWRRSARPTLGRTRRRAPPGRSPRTASEQGVYRLAQNMRVGPRTPAGNAAIKGCSWPSFWADTAPSSPGCGRRRSRPLGPGSCGPAPCTARRRGPCRGSCRCTRTARRCRARLCTDEGARSFATGTCCIYRILHINMNGGGGGECGRPSSKPTVEAGLAQALVDLRRAVRAGVAVRALAGVA